MAKSTTPDQTSRSRRPPAKTLEARENQLIALAVDAAEQQLRDGTASSQVITHFLKQGTVREELEREKLKSDNLLLQAKIEAIASGKRVYAEALDAMRSYAGHEVDKRNDDY